MSKIYKKFNSVNVCLKRPRVTEKSTVLSTLANPAYTFEVKGGFNKHEIKSAIKEMYGVTPVKVNIINTPSKKVYFKGKEGSKSGVRKMMVFLKKGEKIEFI